MKMNSVLGWTKLKIQFGQGEFLLDVFKDGKPSRFTGVSKQHRSYTEQGQGRLMGL